jgi:rhodanese-related sulfurtransferase
MAPTVSIDDIRNGSVVQAKVIDVRSVAEFAIGHIPGAVNVPMEQVDARMADIGAGPLVVTCEAGTRAAIVAGWLTDRQPVSVLAGGTAAWRKAGLPLVACASSGWSLERQVRFAAGLIVLTATLLAVFFHPGWVYVAMFVGAGLTFAGATNICGMAILLARMPWNRALTTTASNVTQVSAPCRR